MNTKNPELLLDNQLCFATYAATNAFAQAYRPLLSELGLTYTQYLTMLILWEKDDLSVREIGNRLYLDSGTLTPLLKRLELMKYINRKRDNNDERLVRISLTQRGSAARESATCIPKNLLQLMSMKDSELADLASKLKKLAINLRNTI